MQQTLHHPRNDAARAVVGVLLVVIGAAVLGLRQAGLDLNEAIGSSLWPFFVIVPGLVLLGAAILPAPPRGVGFAVAGAIVSTVGGLLLYQARTGDWESWAYAWALIPLAAGVAMVVYGLVAHVPGLVTAGSWTGGIAAVALIVGAWFFAPAFAGADRRLDIETWWPAVAIAVGVLMMVRALVSPRAATPPDTRAATPPEGPAVDGPTI